MVKKSVTNSSFFFSAVASSKSIFFQKKKRKKRKQVAGRGFGKAGYKSPLVGVAQPLCARLSKSHANLAALFDVF